MALKLFNTLTRKIELFEPLDPANVGLYTCGPTVYNSPHIGNYRAYVFGDILKRYLLYRGYKVKHIMNITDVDDKTIRDSQIQHKELKEFTEFYTKIFLKDIKSLNILQADKYTKATDYIKEMIELVEVLLIKGFAYKVEDGSIYFNIEKDLSYGKLSHFKISNLKKNASGRLMKDEYEKENIADFVLWKAWAIKDGNVFWEPKKILNRETELVKGRPGWHIECSAMSLNELGQSFDIHTGGVDNIFPHHENEIAQSECATGKPFVKYFMHNEFLLVEGKKMSKSLGNIVTLENIAEKKISPIAYRYWLLTAHYRTLVNFTWKALGGAQTALDKLYDRIIKYKTIGKVNKNYQTKFHEYINNDLNTPQAIALLWELTKDKEISDVDKKATMLDFDKVLGLGFAEKTAEEIPEKIIKLAEEREQFRKTQDWDKSDELRGKIKELGYEIEDTDDGVRISKYM